MSVAVVAQDTAITYWSCSNKHRNIQQSATRAVTLLPIKCLEGYLPVMMCMMSAFVLHGCRVTASQWLSYNGLAFLGASVQPGLVPAAAVAAITVQRYQAMSSADSTHLGPQVGDRMCI